MDNEFDFSGLKDVLIAAGLNPAEPHDMRLFSAELSDPGTTFTEAAQRAGARKIRAAQGSGFDQLNEYMQALRNSSKAPAKQHPSDHTMLDSLQTLELAIANFREKGFKK